VRTEDEFERACTGALASSRSRRAIVEEFMEGPELSLDAVVQAGRITICGVADRMICFPPYFVEMGHTMPTSLEERQRVLLEKTFVRGIQALGIESGAAKGDLKLTSSGPMIGEIAARLSGGYMSGWTYPLATGVDLTGAALAIAIGGDSGPLDPRWQKVSAERALISMPGVVSGIEGVGDARNVNGVAEVFILKASGDRASFPTNNVEKCGNVISVGISRAQAIDAAETALQRILVRLEPNNEDTDRFIAEARWPAFTLENVANRKALKTMVPVEGEGDSIGVLPLPMVEREPGRDWYGTILDEAAKAALRITGTGFRLGGGRVLGRRFWDALLSGGVQGGVYAVESERARG
jgi:biotin carboxylase